MTVSGSNTTEATIINLIPSTTYIVQVAAINDAGDGVYSDPLTNSTNKLFCNYNTYNCNGSDNCHCSDWTI